MDTLQKDMWDGKYFGAIFQKYYLLQGCPSKSSEGIFQIMATMLPRFLKKFLGFCDFIFKDHF